MGWHSVPAGVVAGSSRTPAALSSTSFTAPAGPNTPSGLPSIVICAAAALPSLNTVVWRNSMSMDSPVCSTFWKAGFPSEQAENHNTDAALTVTRCVVVATDGVATGDAGTVGDGAAEAGRAGGLSLAICT